MPFCSKCGTEVPESAKFCNSCGDAVQNSTIAAEPVTEKPKKTVIDKLEKANEIHFAMEYMKILYFEITIVAIAAGIYMKSWYVFGGVIVGLSILYFAFRKIAVLFNIIFTIIWGVVGYFGGYYFSGQQHLSKAAVISCLVALLISAIIHFGISAPFHNEEE